MSRYCQRMSLADTVLSDQYLTKGSAIDLIACVAGNIMFGICKVLLFNEKEQDRRKELENEINASLAFINIMTLSKHDWEYCLYEDKDKKLSAHNILEELSYEIHKPFIKGFISSYDSDNYYADIDRMHEELLLIAQELSCLLSTGDFICIQKTQSYINALGKINDRF